MTAAAETNHAKGPLAGITVVDLSRILAGPYCTLLMAELGARVIKVETPGTGDDARAYGPFVNGKSAYFQSVNRGKESIALNLKQDGDRATFDQLLAMADVVVENFRPGTMEKLGYGWDQLHPKYPRLIYAAASGFGHSGPEMYRPAYDMVVQGMGGIMSVTGHPGTPPTRIGMSIGDIGSGLYTAVGLLSYIHRQRQPGQDSNPVLSSDSVTTTLAKDCLLMAALTTHVGTHVLNNAKQRHSYFAKHLDALASIQQGDVLRRCDYHGARQWHILRHGQLDIAGTRRHIDH